MSDKVESIARSAIAGMRWNYVGSLVSAGASLLVGTVLARILGPGPFGQAVVATTIYSLVNLFVDGGFSQALIQQPSLSERDIRRTFTCQVGIGLLCTLLIYLGASPIAACFHLPEAVPVVRAIAPLLVLQSFGLVSAALLRRNMRFRLVQCASIGSYLFGYACLGIPLAFAGWGVWSLVLAYLAQSASNTGFLYCACRHSIRPCFGFPPRSISRFGGVVIGSNLVYWAHTNLDNLAASSRGGFALGLYGRACNLVYQPCNAGVGSMQSVLLSAVAKVRGQKELLRQIALASMGVILGLLGPAYAAFVAAPATVLLGLYGDKWIPAIHLMVPLALSMPFFGSLRLLNSLACGLGRPELEFVPQALSCIPAIAIYFAAARISLLALGWAVLAIMLLRFALSLVALCRLLNLPPGRVLPVLAGRLLYSTAFATCAAGFDHVLTAVSSLSAGSRLVALLFFCVALLGISIWLASPLVFGREAVLLMARYRSHLPTAYQRRLAGWGLQMPILGATP